MGNSVARSGTCLQLTGLKLKRILLTRDSLKPSFTQRRSLSLGYHLFSSCPNQALVVLLFAATILI